MEEVKFNRFPAIEVGGNHESWLGWNEIIKKLNTEFSSIPDKQKTIVIETYQGVIHEEVENELKGKLNHALWINSSEGFKAEEEVKKMVFPDVTDDRIFGYLTRLNMKDYLDNEKVAQIQEEIENQQEGTVFIYGPGASLIARKFNKLIYADMARWEIQLRMRRYEVDNLGIRNRDTKDWMLLYKQGFFLDWRVCDRLKKQLFDKIDFVLDTNIKDQPKMVEGKAMLDGLDEASNRPFSVVPFFDPGPWGGQWMKHHCNLDKSAENYAWCFNCVPEENSLLLKFRDTVIEIPSINLVFRHPRRLLGDPVHGRFGDEFPIRFDFLDTMEGGNLSLQVHPLTEYIQEKFGIPYTQDESYYMMETGENAVVYLGLKEGVEPEKMIAELEEARETGKFDAEKHVQTWPVKKHDHVLIPAGTVHCSGKNSMVLEISATPYIFTFKLWDWGRLGMDGKPRPINIEHGKNVIQWDRTTNWTKKNLVNRVEKIAEGDGWIEEGTGLHEREFIETRRFWFSKPIHLNTGGTEKGGVHVICLVEGDEITIESPTQSFSPFVVHYAEVFIIPAGVGEYIVKPSGSISSELGILLAYVRN